MSINHRLRRPRLIGITSGFRITYLRTYLLTYLENADKVAFASTKLKPQKMYVGDTYTRSKFAVYDVIGHIIRRHRICQPSFLESHVIICYFIDFDFSYYYYYYYYYYLFFILSSHQGKTNFWHGHVIDVVITLTGHIWHLWQQAVGHKNLGCDQIQILFFTNTSKEIYSNVNGREIIPLRSTITLSNVTQQKTFKLTNQVFNTKPFCSQRR